MDPTTSSAVNILHSPEVISAIISALAGVIMGFFGWLAGKSNRTVKKTLWDEQLKNLYEPLDYLLSFSNKKSAYELLHEINSIISEHYRYLTPDVQNELNILCKKEDLSMSDFQNLKMLVSSTYNWLRKKLSYPYNKTSIRRSTVVMHTKDMSTRIAMLPLLLSGCSVLLTFISVINLGNSEIVPPSADAVWTSTVSNLYLILPIVLVSFMFLEDIVDTLVSILSQLVKLLLRIFTGIKGYR